MRKTWFIGISAALISVAVGDVQPQSKDSVVRGSVESVLSALEREDAVEEGRAAARDRDGRAGDVWSQAPRSSADRGRDDDKWRRADRRERERAEARWRKSREREVRSCEKEMWRRVRRERDRWDDDRYVRSTKDRIHRICERRVNGWGRDRDWRDRLFERFGRW